MLECWGVCVSSDNAAVVQFGLGVSLSCSDVHANAWLGGFEKSCWGHDSLDAAWRQRRQIGPRYLSLPLTLLCQEGVAQALLCSPSPRIVNVKADAAEVHGGLHLFCVKGWDRVVFRRLEYLWVQSPDKFRHSPAFGPVNWYGAVEGAIVQKGTSTDLLFAKDDNELQKSFGVVVGVEERETLREESHQDDTC